MSTLYVGWRSKKKQKWYTIGCLIHNGEYRFVYTGGAFKAKNECGFTPLANFPDFDSAYESEELFPFFKNRVLTTRRPEFRTFMGYLDLADDDPMGIMARSGGRRETDYYELFPAPRLDDSGRYATLFFAHGVSHLPPAAKDRIDRIDKGENLLLIHDFMNPFVPDAYAVRTDNTISGERNDNFIVGYLPRFLTNDVNEYRKTGNIELAAEKVNPKPAPTQYRLLCRLTAEAPPGYQPCSSEDYRPLVPE